MRSSRGAESASILEPVKKQLTILGLGGSIATPHSGITGQVLPVASFADLAAAVNYAAAHAHVVSNSYGGGENGSSDSSRSFSLATRGTWDS